MSLSPKEREARQVVITKVKVGEWKTRTFYDLTVEGEYIGRYRTIKECDRVAEDHIKDTAEYWKSLGELFS